MTNEIKMLAERIDTLETRLAYQDDTIETLNQTITAQWKQIDVLTRQLAQLSERLQEAEANVPAATAFARTCFGMIGTPAPNAARNGA